MTSPHCEYCGHVNRPGARLCDACDFPLGGDRTAGWADPSRDAGWAASDPFVQGAPGGAIPAPPFKDVGDVLSPMLAVYRKHFTLVGILVLLTTLPEALLQYSARSLTPSEPAHPSFGVVGLAVASTVLFWLLSVAGASLLSGSLVYAVVDVQRAGRASARECLVRGLKVLPKVFVTSLCYGVVAFAGYLLLLVPGVIFSLMFAVCVPVAVIEMRGPVEALARSKEMTKGYKGLMFITYFLWWVLVMVLTLLVTWSFTTSDNLDPLPTLLLQTVVVGMLNSSLHVLTVYIYLGLLRERHTGFQANAFTPGPEAAAR